MALADIASAASHQSDTVTSEDMIMRFNTNQETINETAAVTTRNATDIGFLKLLTRLQIPTDPENLWSFVQTPELRQLTEAIRHMQAPGSHSEEILLESALLFINRLHHAVAAEDVKQVNPETVNEVRVEAAAAKKFLLDLERKTSFTLKTEPQEGQIPVYSAARIDENPQLDSILKKLRKELNDKRQLKVSQLETIRCRDDDYLKDCQPVISIAALKEKIATRRDSEAKVTARSVVDGEYGHRKRQLEDVLGLRITSIRSTESMLLAERFISSVDSPPVDSSVIARQIRTLEDASEDTLTRRVQSRLEGLSKALLEVNNCSTFIFEKLLATIRKLPLRASAGSESITESDIAHLKALALFDHHQSFAACTQFCLQYVTCGAAKNVDEASVLKSLKLWGDIHTKHEVVHTVLRDRFQNSLAESFHIEKLREVRQFVQQPILQESNKQYLKRQAQRLITAAIQSRVNATEGTLIIEPVKVRGICNRTEHAELFIKTSEVEIRRSATIGPRGELSVDQKKIELRCRSEDEVVVEVCPNSSCKFIQAGLAVADFAVKPWMRTEGWYRREIPQFSYLPGVLDIEVREHVHSVRAVLLFSENEVVDEHTSRSAHVALHFPGMPLCGAVCRREQLCISVNAWERGGRQVLSQRIALSSLPMCKRHWKSTLGLVTVVFREHNDPCRFVKRKRAAIKLSSFAKQVLRQRRQLLKECVAELHLSNVRFICTLQERTESEIKRLAAIDQLTSTLSVGGECVASSLVDRGLTLSKSKSAVGIKFAIRAASQPLCFALSRGKHVMCAGTVQRASILRSSSAPMKVHLTEGLILRQVKKLQLRVLRALCTRSGLEPLGLGHVERFHLTCSATCERETKSSGGSTRSLKCESIYEWSDGVFQFSALGDSAIDPLSVVKIVLLHRDVEVGEESFCVMDALDSAMKAGEWRSFGSAFKVFIKATVEESRPLQTAGHVEISNAVWAPLEVSSLVNSVAKNLSQQVVNAWITQCCSHENRATKEVDDRSRANGNGATTASALKIQRVFRGSCARKQLHTSLCCSSGIVQVKIQRVYGMGFDKLQKVCTKAVLLPSAVSQQGLPAWAAKGQCKFANELLQLAYHAVGPSSSRALLELELSILNDENTPIAKTRINCIDILLHPSSWRNRSVSCHPQGQLCLKLQFTPNNTVKSLPTGPAIYLSATFLPAKTESKQASNGPPLKEHHAFKLVRQNKHEALVTLLDNIDHKLGIQLRSRHGLCLLTTAIMANSVETVNALLSKGYQWIGSPPPRSLRMAQCLGVLPKSAQLVTTESQRNAMREVCASGDAKTGRRLLTKLVLSSASRYNSPSDIVDMFTRDCEDEREGRVTVESIISLANQGGLSLSGEEAKELLKLISKEGQVTSMAMSKYIEQEYSDQTLVTLHKLSRWTAKPKTAGREFAYLKGQGCIPTVHEVDWDVLVKSGSTRVLKKIKLYCSAEEVVIPFDGELPVPVNDIILVRCLNGLTAYRELGKRLAVWRFTQKFAAVQIQDTFRRHRSKPASQQLRQGRAAAIVIQRFFKERFRCRRRVLQDLAERDAAARRLQKFYLQWIALRSRKETATASASNPFQATGELLSKKSANELADTLSLCNHIKQGIASEVVVNAASTYEHPVSMQFMLAKDGSLPAYGICIQSEDLVKVKVEHLRKAVAEVFEINGIKSDNALHDTQSLLSQLHHAFLADNQDEIKQCIQRLATKALTKRETVERVAEGLKSTLESLYAEACSKYDGFPWKCLRFIHRDLYTSYCWASLHKTGSIMEAKVPIDSDTVETLKRNVLLFSARELAKTVDLFTFLCAFKHVARVRSKAQAPPGEADRVVHFETECKHQLLRLEAIMMGRPAFKAGIQQVVINRLVVSDASSNRVIEIDFCKPASSLFSTTMWTEPEGSPPFHKEGKLCKLDDVRESGYYRVYWDGDVAIGDRWVPCRIIGYRASNMPQSSMLLVEVESTNLGWMETLDSNGQLRLIMQLDRDFCNGLFGNVSAQLDPANADMSLRLSQLVRTLREVMVEAHGTVKQTFTHIEKDCRNEEMLAQFLRDMYRSTRTDVEDQRLQREAFLFLASRLMSSGSQISEKIWLDVFEPKLEGDFYILCKELQRNANHAKRLKQFIKKKSSTAGESWALGALLESTEEVPKPSLVSVASYFAGLDLVEAETMMHMVDKELAFHFPCADPKQGSCDNPLRNSKDNRGIVPEDITQLPQKFFKQTRMVRLLKSLRGALLDEQLTPLRTSQLRELFKQCGSNSAGELRTQRLLKTASLTIVRDNLRHEKVRKLFFAYFESQPGALSINDFARLLGQYRLAVSTTKGTATVRWKTKWFNEDTQQWCERVITKYRYEDDAVQLRDSHDNPQGFIKLTKRTFKFTNNLWSSKPWGRDILFKELQAIYK